MVENRKSRAQRRELLEGQVLLVRQALQPTELTAPDPVNIRSLSHFTGVAAGAGTGRATPASRPRPSTTARRQTGSRRRVAGLLFFRAEGAEDELPRAGEQ